MKRAADLFEFLSQMIKAILSNGILKESA